MRPFAVFRETYLIEPCASCGHDRKRHAVRVRFSARNGVTTRDERSWGGCLVGPFCLCPKFAEDDARTFCRRCGHERQNHFRSEMDPRTLGSHEGCSRDCGCDAFVRPACSPDCAMYGPCFDCLTTRPPKQPLPPARTLTWFERLRHRLAKLVTRRLRRTRRRQLPPA